jgi:hypothetical protein
MNLPLSNSPSWWRRAAWRLNQLRPVVQSLINRCAYAALCTGHIALTRGVNSIGDCFARAGCGLLFRPQFVEPCSVLVTALPRAHNQIVLVVKRRLPINQHLECFSGY